MAYRFLHRYYRGSTAVSRLLLLGRRCCFYYSDSIVSSTRSLSTAAAFPTIPVADMMRRQRHSRSYLSDTSLLPEPDILSFIKSSFNEPQGPNHRWLNNMDGCRKAFNQDGIFLVVVNVYIKDSSLLDRRECIGTLERVKMIQQRYPKLNVFGLQCGISINSVTAQTQIIQTIMEEYITFPILISDKDFLKMIHGACYLFFDGCTNHLIHHKLDIDIGIIMKVIEEFNILQKGNTVLLQNSNTDWSTGNQVVEEPSICSSLRNLLLCYPGCVSVDENGARLFISDSNHHRIIITDDDGKILDCIGSSPGFEDGEFESAKLLRPAASLYDVTENSLYFVDSENHAIRKADLEKRVLETLYPVSVQKTSGIWSWFLDKLGLAREVDKKAERYDLDSLNYPWHLIKFGETDLLIINRSFETSWIMSMTTGEITKILRGTKAILEICEDLIRDKVYLVNDIHGSLSQRTLDHCFPLGSLLYPGLISSVAKLEKNIFFCDPAAQRILKFDGESRSTSYIQLSELGVLGLPYWSICPLERVSNSAYLDRSRHEQLHQSTVLPGRCDIRVNVDIPKGTELVAPLEMGCIWRQVRGSAADVSGSEELDEKVGVAQQWYDELDNLAFSEVESSLQDERRSTNRSFQDKDKVNFNCTVNISPGTGEIVVSAVLYLQLKKSQGNWEEPDLEARRILDLQKPDSRKMEKDAWTGLLLETCRDTQGIIFVKPINLRLRLECADHPPAITSKETIIVESTLEFNISLD